MCALPSRSPRSTLLPCSLLCSPPLVPRQKLTQTHARALHLPRTHRLPPLASLYPHRCDIAAPVIPNVIALLPPQCDLSRGSTAVFRSPGPEHSAPAVLVVPGRGMSISSLSRTHSPRQHDRTRSVAARMHAQSVATQAERLHSPQSRGQSSARRPRSSRLPAHGSLGRTAPRAGYTPWRG
jgi:hypothetical protein